MGEEMGFARPEIVELRHTLLKALREFFFSRGYLEVETPYLLRTAPPDLNIEPLAVYIGERGPYFLHTSPEVSMKKLLPARARIFQICKVFRAEPPTPQHATEFTMLEWYSEGDYSDGIEETMELLEFVSERLDLGRGPLFRRPFPILDVEELIVEECGLDPFLLDEIALRAEMQRRGLLRREAEDAPWNDLFFILLFSATERRMVGQKPYFLLDWPLSISSMAKRKGQGKVERFEVYMEGLEIANGYTELLDPVEQRERFIRENEERKRLGRRTFEIDEEFLSVLGQAQGPFAGVSLGVDRLLMCLIGAKDIREVLPPGSFFPT
jgi:lysyl-tRNA synthetase class 2